MTTQLSMVLKHVLGHSFFSYRGLIQLVEAGYSAMQIHKWECGKGHLQRVYSRRISVLLGRDFKDCGKELQVCEYYSNHVTIY